MTQAKIVIIEDEKEISDLIKIKLAPLEKNVIVYSDGLQGLNYINELSSPEELQLLILDRMLPSLNGLEICKQIRKNEKLKKLPILMLTALGTAEQIIEGLDAGADDYMSKPFDLNILLARIRSLIRRFELDQSNEGNKTSKIVVHKDLKVDMDQCQAWINQEKIDLTLSEYKLLCCFLMSPGKVLTRNQLVEYIQDGPVHVTDRTIDTHIFGLRKKLGTASSLIETIRGIGYRVISND